MGAFALVRTRLVNDRPYYAEALFRLRPLAAPGLGTFGVDPHWRIYLDPAMLPGGAANLDVADIASVLEHEINHLLREHATRMDAHAGSGYHRDTANLASDLEINDDLDPECHAAKYGVLPHKYALPANLTSEQYYDLLMAQQDNNNDDESDLSHGKENTEDADTGATAPGDNSSTGDSDDSSDDSTGDSDDSSDDSTGDSGDSSDDSTGDSGDVNAARNAPDTTSTAAGGCGSGSGGTPLDCEIPADSDLADAVNPGEARLIQHATAQAVQQHERAHGQGSIPGGLGRWAERVLTPPTVPWTRVLASAIRAGVSAVRGRTDYSYARMSRRATCTPGVALPGMITPTPSVAVIVDMSGSMSDAMITEALSEIDGIARQLALDPTHLHLVQVDAAVGSITGWTGGRGVPITGGGGTDLRVGFEALRTLRNRANIVIALTDGYTPWPTSKPAGVAKTVIGLIGANDAMMQRTREQVPWASVVRVGGDA